MACLLTFFMPPEPDSGSGMQYARIGASPVAQGQRICLRCRSHRRRSFHPWVRKLPRRRAWQPTPAFLPGESHGQRNLVTVPRVTESQLKWLSTHAHRHIAKVCFELSSTQVERFPKGLCGRQIPPSQSATRPLKKRKTPRANSPVHICPVSEHTILKK